MKCNIYRNVLISEKHTNKTIRNAHTLYMDTDRQEYKNYR